MDFKMFEASIPAERGEIDNSPKLYVLPQGMLRKSAAVKVWDKIGVGKSGDGFGVYAIDDIKDNEVIEECPIIEMSRDEVKGTVLMDYLFKVSADLYVLALGSGSIYNHRNQPNARWEYDQEKKIIRIVSTTAIEMGNEIYISFGKDYFKTREKNMKT